MRAGCRLAVAWAAAVLDGGERSAPGEERSREERGARSRRGRHGGGGCVRAELGVVVESRGSSHRLGECGLAEGNFDMVVWVLWQDGAR